jgi:GST-like protein
VLWNPFALLLYLAEKIHRFIPDGLAARFDTIQWLFWQMANLGPMAGQNGHFSSYAPEKIPYAIDRYVQETNRLYGVMNRRLADREFIAGQYSIADMACYPWILPHEAQGQNIADFPHLRRWLESIQARPAVVRAYEKGRAINPKPTMTDEAKKILFGQTAKTVEKSE